jgi:ribosomal protein L37E
MPEAVTAPGALGARGWARGREVDVSDVQDYAARFIVDEFMVDKIPPEYLKHKIEEMERDAIYQAVKQVSGWICIKPEIVERKDYMTRGIEYSVRVHVRPVEVARVYVYPQFETNPMIRNQIPKDLFFCDYCGGHTKNDMRGHCGACGGPRKEYRWDK